MAAGVALFWLVALDHAGGSGDSVGGAGGELFDFICDGFVSLGAGVFGFGADAESDHCGDFGVRVDFVAFLGGDVFDVFVAGESGSDAAGVGPGGDDAAHGLLHAGADRFASPDLLCERGYFDSCADAPGAGIPAVEGVMDGADDIFLILFFDDHGTFS